MRRLVNMFEKESMEGDALTRGSEDMAITPLIEAKEAYAAIEQAILNAQEEVILAYWTFAPEMNLMSPGLREGLSTWKDLIAAKVREGVTFRILISDFDPVLTAGFHADAVRAYLALIDIRTSLPEEAQDRLQLILSRHDGRSGRLSEAVMQPLRWMMLARECRRARRLRRSNGAESLRAWVREHPCLWSMVQLKGDGPHPSPRFGYGPIYTAVHHEKTCIVDRRAAFLGGLDIHPKRYDDASHQAENAWHDLSVRLEGADIAPLVVRLAQRWNEERSMFHRCYDGLRPPVAYLPGPVKPFPVCPSSGMEVSEEGQSGTASKISRLRFHSTCSRSSRSPFRRSPRPVEEGIRQAILNMIEEAEDLLYIETQYFRDPQIAKALVQRARRVPNLRMILMLPLVPDLLAETRKPNAASRHGQWLEARNIERLREAFGTRFEVYTLVRNGPAKPEALTQVVAYESDMVYCHAKLAIADDRVCLLGSANLNGRSLSIDTEACVEWRDGSEIKAFRQRLWRQHFGGGAAGGPEPEGLVDVPLAEAAQAWHHLAVCNQLRSPSRRAGFVVPMPDKHVQFAAKRNFLVPDLVV